MTHVFLSFLVLTFLAAEARAARPNYLTAPRARKAFKQSEGTLKAAFKRRGLRYPPKRIFIRIFKKERVLELWSRGSDGRYAKVKDYPVCYASGRLGPKRRQGDRQVPEGIYHVNAINPWSSYHLALGVSYPNRADRKRGRKGKLGGAIMIHGDCVSIGCVAITDRLIEQVYVAAARARAAASSSWDISARVNGLPASPFQPARSMPLNRAVNPSGAGRAAAGGVAARSEATISKEATMQSSVTVADPAITRGAGDSTVSRARSPAVRRVRGGSASRR